MVMLCWKGCRALMPVPRPTPDSAGVLSFGARSWPCRLLGLVIWVWITSMWSGLLDHGRQSRPLPLVKDGDLIATVQHMILCRGPDTVRETEVNCHATEADLEQGRVRAEVRLGNIQADTAADLSRRYQSERRLWISGGPWLILGSSGIPMWCRDGRGGIAPDPLVWDQGSPSKRKVDIR